MNNNNNLVILIGASGYIGQQFINELIDRDIRFFELSRKTIDYYNFDIDWFALIFVPICL